MRIIRYYLLATIGGTLIGYLGLFLIVELFSGRPVDLANITNQLSTAGLLAVFIASGSYLGFISLIRVRIPAFFIGERAFPTFQFPNVCINPGEPGVYTLESAMN